MRDKEHRQYWAVRDYMNGRFSFNDVYKQIKEKVCPLPYSLRQYVLSLYDKNGNFIENER